MQVRKGSLNFENITKGIVSKHHKTLINSKVSLKPQFEWLQNYLAVHPPKPDRNTAQKGEKPNMSKKNTTRRLLKTRQKVAQNN